MALEVETGLGSAIAESYASVVDANLYHANRGNAAWAALASDSLREQALRKATDYLTQNYRGRWKGIKTFPSVQALDWPRYNVIRDDDDNLNIYLGSETIPIELKNAACELALRSLTESLAPDLERLTRSEAVGSLSVTYEPGSPQYKQYRAVDMILRPLLDVSRVSMEVVRA